MYIIAGVIVIIVIIVITGFLLHKFAEIFRNPYDADDWFDDYCHPDFDGYHNPADDDDDGYCYSDFDDDDDDDPWWFF